MFLSVRTTILYVRATLKPPLQSMHSPSKPWGFRVALQISISTDSFKVERP